MYIYSVQVISLDIKIKVFANSSEDRSSIQAKVIQKTQKRVLDTALLN